VQTFCKRRAGLSATAGLSCCYQEGHPASISALQKSPSLQIGISKPLSDDDKISAILPHNKQLYSAVATRKKHWSKTLSSHKNDIESFADGACCCVYFPILCLYLITVCLFSCTALFVSISQVIGCEDRLRNDLYCVGWGVKLCSTCCCVKI